MFRIYVWDFMSALMASQYCLRDEQVPDITTIYPLCQLIFCFQLIIKDGKFQYMAVFHVSISTFQSLAIVFFVLLKTEHNCLNPFASGLTWQHISGTSTLPLWLLCCACGMNRSQHLLHFSLYQLMAVIFSWSLRMGNVYKYNFLAMLYLFWLPDWARFVRNIMCLGLIRCPDGDNSACGMNRSR